VGVGGGVVVVDVVFESMFGAEFLAIRETLSVTPTTVGFTPLHFKLLTITSLRNSNIKPNERR
jgi:hypothetical protein